MTIRRLLLIRHAKAAQGGPDEDRPLTERGCRDAAAIGRWLIANDAVPDLVLVSPARRAAETWQQAASVLPAPPALLTEPRIYDNTPASVLAAIHEVSGTVRTVAVVGHNPAVQQLAGLLDPTAGELAGGCPTSAVVVFGVPAPFAELRAGSARLTGFAAPRG